jgi:hypothetical protein
VAKQAGTDHHHAGPRAIASSEANITMPPQRASPGSPSRGTSQREVVANRKPPKPNSITTAPAAASNAPGAGGWR